MQLTPKSELDARMEKLQVQLDAGGLDGALILQNADLFYFSGTIQRSHLYVPADPSLRPLLMTRKSLARARRESRLEESRIVSLNNPRQMLELMGEHGLPAPRRLGMELDVLPVNTFRYYERILGGVELIDCSPTIHRLRAIKSAYELDLIRRAAQASQAIYLAIPALLREGMTELELASQLEAIARQAGHQGIIRMRSWNNEIAYGHLMAGASAAVPSYMDSPTGGPGLNPAIAQGASTRPIRAHEPLLVDYLFSPDGYLVDQTRIFAIGKIAADLVHAHEAMLAVQAAIVAAARPGATGGELWDLAAQTAAEWGVGDHFMGHGHDRVRFVGHGVGLELDELPILAARQALPLEEGMVIALEPKATFPGRGVVGIENTHVVTGSGLERLTRLGDEIVYV